MDKWIVDQDLKHRDGDDVTNPLIIYEVLREAMLVREWQLKYIFGIPDYNIELAKKKTEQTAEQLIKVVGKEMSKKYGQLFGSADEQNI